MLSDRICFEAGWDDLAVDPVCVMCGVSFPPGVRRSLWDVGAVRVCSRDCRAAFLLRIRRSRPKRPSVRADGTSRPSFGISVSARLAIYVRDGWVCQLCWAPVDRAVHWPDPASPSLDHIECQSWVLVPDHSPANLRLAHLGCNVARGNESRRMAAVAASN